MSDRQFERAVIDWLEDGSDRTPGRAIDGVLLAVKTTPQERDLRIPWRFPNMPAFSRASGLAAVALVAVIGAGALVYFSSNRPGVGGQGSPTPTVVATPTLPPGISGWTPYTSAVYGFQMAYPSDWLAYAPATHKWTLEEPTPNDAWPYADVFTNPEKVDGDSIGLWVWQMPAPAKSDLATWEGLEAMAEEICNGPGLACPSADPPTRLCVGQQQCVPAIIVLTNDEKTPNAYFGDPETGVVSVFSIGREDAFPAAARYGGTVALLKAILTQVDVREPEPGETPH